MIAVASLLVVLILSLVGIEERADARRLAVLALLMRALHATTSGSSRARRLSSTVSLGPLQSWIVDAHLRRRSLIEAAHLLFLATVVKEKR